MISYLNLLFPLKSMSCCFFTISSILDVFQYGLLQLGHTFSLSFISSFGSHLWPHLSHRHPFNVICGMYPEYKPSVFMAYYNTAYDAKIPPYSTFLFLGIQEATNACNVVIAAISKCFHIEL
jgi:hypothetical protein